MAFKNRVTLRWAIGSDRQQHVRKAGDWCGKHVGPCWGYNNEPYKMWDSVTVDALADENPDFLHRSDERITTFRFRYKKDAVLFALKWA